MTFFDAFIWRSNNPFLHAMLNALESHCREYLLTERQSISDYGTLWAFIDSCHINFSEVEPEVVTNLGSFLAALNKMRECANQTLHLWEKARGSGLRKSHDEVIEIETAQKILKHVARLFRYWEIEQGQI